ncbi:hypothetical protein J6590_030686 [Homalodisca vitripennis]|nr:hypothetical protein J6590_030686 [Homalodisca vitripennis]
MLKSRFNASNMTSHRGKGDQQHNRPSLVTSCFCLLDGTDHLCNGVQSCVSLSKAVLPEREISGGFDGRLQSRFQQPFIELPRGVKHTKWPVYRRGVRVTFAFADQRQPLCGVLITNAFSFKYCS